MYVYFIHSLKYQVSVRQACTYNILCQSSSTFKALKPPPHFNNYDDILFTIYWSRKNTNGFFLKCNFFLIYIYFNQIHVTIHNNQDFCDVFITAYSQPGNSRLQTGFWLVLAAWPRRRCTVFRQVFVERQRYRHSALRLAAPPPRLGLAEALWRV